MKTNHTPGKFPSMFVNVSGRKDFPFVAMMADGRCIGYFKRSDDAGKCCAAIAKARGE